MPIAQLLRAPTLAAALAVAGSTVAIPVGANPLSPAQTAAIDAAAARALADTGVPTASIAVVRDGGPTIERFLFDFGSRKLEITIRAEPSDAGHVEEFMAAPVS